MAITILSSSTANLNLSTTYGAALAGITEDSDLSLVVCAYCANWANDYSQPTVDPFNGTAPWLYDGTTPIGAFTQLTKVTIEDVRVFLDASGVSKCSSGIWIYRNPPTDLTSGLVMVFKDNSAYCGGSFVVHRATGISTTHEVKTDSSNLVESSSLSATVTDGACFSVAIANKAYGYGDVYVEFSPFYKTSTGTGSLSSSFTWSGSAHVSHAAYFVEAIAAPESPVSFFVDSEVIGGNKDGTSWENAFASLPLANAATEAGRGDFIYIKACTITDINEEIIPKDSVSWIGGFSRLLTGTNAPVDERSPFVDITKIKMTPLNYATNKFGCIGEGTIGDADNVTIDGIHFYDCENDYAVTSRRGGAIRCNGNTGWLVQSCKFFNCSVGSAGSGGAICAVSAQGFVVYSCEFSECTADNSGYGGAVAFHDSNGYFFDNRVIDCSAVNGGGLSIYRTKDSSQGVEVRSYFSGCAASDSGDSIWVSNPYAQISISRSDLVNGVGPSTSCALYVENDNTGIDTRVDNSLIAMNANDGFRNGGALTYDRTLLINCTIADNDGYGINFLHGSSRYVSASNSIIWGNVAGSVNTALSSCTYSDVEDGHIGTGNIDADPLFRGVGDVLRYALNGVTDCIDGGNASVTGYQALDKTSFSRVDTPDMGAYEFTGLVHPPGGIDTSLYRLQLHGVVNTSPAPINFVIPFLTAETWDEVEGFGFGDYVFGNKDNTECHPLRFGGQHRKDSSTSYIKESWLASASNQKIARHNNVNSATPTWEAAFNDADQSEDDASIGTTGMVSRGKKFIGTFKNEVHHPMYEIIRYSNQIFDNSLTDEAYIYNIWIENFPKSERETESCARWIMDHVGVSDPDIPVSSGLMIELIRILNKIAWEAREPMSVPVFGKYIIYTPPAPVS